MHFIAMPRGRRLADMSALTIAFVICLAVIVFSWPKDRSDETDVRFAGCCEVQTAELEPVVPVAAGAGATALRRNQKP
jgi:hypothetical protein